MFRTLAARLTFLYAMLFCLLSLIVFVFVSYSMEAHLLGMVDLELREEAEEYAKILSEQGLPALKREVQIENEGKDVESRFVRIFDAQQNLILSSNLRAWKALPPHSRNLEKAQAGWAETLSVSAYSVPVRIFQQTLGNGYLFQAGVLLTRHEMLMSHFRKVFAATFTVVVLAGGIIGFYLAQRALVGVQKVREAADQISGGDLGGEIIFQDEAEEINSLIHSINRMKKRIKALIQELQDVTNNIAHDLRSPITRMRGLAETTLTGEQTLDDYRGLAGVVVEECDSLVGVINTMLEIAETDAGIRPLTLQPVEIAAIVQDVAELYSAVAENKEIHVALKISGPSLYVSGDRSRLQRAFANLLDNALKFTPVGGRVLLEAWQEGAMVFIAVTDSGVGISSADLPHVCERFYRADRSRSTPGTGLGLSLVQSIVQAHAGELRIDSDGVSGTRVTIRLKGDGTKLAVS